MKQYKLTSLVFLLASLTAYADPSYYMVFDAGSSGTRMSLYEVLDKNDPNMLPKITQLMGALQPDAQSLRVTPGISDFVNKPDSMWPNLRPLFNQAETYLMERGIKPSQVEVHFYATAGVRLIGAEAQKKLFDLIKKNIKSKSAFQNVAYVGLITGEQEGIFSWFAVNYDALAHGGQTSIVLDMGGASMQISADLGFQPEKYQLPYKKYHIGDREYNISSTSFLGFGLNLVLTRVSNYWQQSYNTCLPQRYTASYIDNPVPIAFSYDACRDIFSHYIRSRGEYNADFRHLSQLVNDRNNLRTIGLDNFYFVMDYFDADTPSELKQAILNRCSGLDEKQVEFMPESFTEERECPKGMYLLGLYDILGFESRDSKVDFYRDNWSKGVVASIILDERS